MKFEVPRSRRVAPGACRYAVWAAALLFTIHVDMARAVIVSAGNGAGNTSAPADDPGFANVGWRGGGSAIYLGNQWVLTAAHVGPGPTIFQGVAYGAVPNSQVSLVNPPGVGFTTQTDLLLYRVDGLPPLPALEIGTSVPGVGSDVALIGRGRDRLSSLGYWDSAWLPTSAPSTYAGFAWGVTNTTRWGTNKIDTINVLQSVSNTSEMSFVMDFDQAGTAFESQGAPGDSGGAVFFKNPSTGQWSLTGMMFAINNFGSQPWGIAAFGNLTFAADLATYRDQIYAHVGLPGDVNFDGLVNVFDINVISSEWKTAGPAGDANLDGIVNIFDVSLVGMNWTQTSGASSVAEGRASANNAPEPGSIVLLAVGAVTLLLARKRWSGLPVRARRA